MDSGESRSIGLILVGCFLQQGGARIFDWVSDLRFVVNAWVVMRRSGTRTEFLRENWSRLVIPSLAVTGVCHLLADPQRRGRPGLVAEFCAALAEDELRVIEATPHDYRRMAELLNTYSSLRLQVVDACVIALAERLDAREVAALDRRDLLVVEPRHPRKGERLTLLPAD